ncbi:peptidase inhibitor family I36 protein [Streptomyces muensis]|uniref:Peptidase inhibitor family I36 protein n=1 Tax=Streptomyces muensis TaxID=1077944 RepID=A0A9X1TKD0_STRM4|nr:peptidase inhibitor family I36 protein [Streptomyces muensis]MCF1595466.1 peptidase inhibitor family I36 protein [Streptomyces muensis]
MKRKLGMSIGVLALSAASVFGMTATAEAADSGTRAYFVIYQHDNYDGMHANFSGTDRNLNNKYWAGTQQIMNNGGSSMRNNTGSYVGMWDKGGTSSCTGDSYTANPNSVDSDFSNNDFDNKGSCVVFL